MNQVVDKLTEVAVGAEKDPLARVLKDAPQLFIAREDDAPVELGGHERALGPDHVVVVDVDLDRGLGPCLYMMPRQAVDRIEDALEALLVRGGGQQHVPPKGIDGSRDDRLVVAAGKRLVGMRLLPVLVLLLVKGDQPVEVGQAVFLDRVELEHLFRVRERTDLRRAFVYPAFEELGVAHVGGAAPLAPTHGAVVRDEH